MPNSEIAQSIQPVASTTAKPHIVYDIDEMPPIREAIPLGLQHLVAMFLGNITPPLIIASTLGLTIGQKVFLVQMALVLAGIATIVQAYPIGPVGGRIPMIMGTSYAFLGAIIGIAQQYNLATAFGACLAACFVEVILGFSIGNLKRFFPPLVSGVVVMLIGLTLVPVGMDYAAGGVGIQDYGSLINLSIAGVVFLITLFLNQYSKGFVSYASLLIGALGGYVIALFFGKVNFTNIPDASWFTLPRPLAFGLEFHLAPIVTMSFIYVISAVETIGDISGTVAATGRAPTRKELKGGLVADGLMSGLGALINGFPNTSYSQNVGLVNFTGVASRHVAAIGGFFLVGLGLIPKVGALVATIPPSVIGGGGLIMFAMIFASGVAIIHRSVELNQRNMIILAASLGLGLAIELRPDALQYFPQELKSFLGSGLISGGLLALILNLIFPENRKNA